MNIVGKALGTIVRNWDADDGILYALGVGAGAVPGGTELAYTTENSDGVPQRVLPSYAAVLGFPPLSFLGDGALGGPTLFGEVQPSVILHADQELSVHAILPAAGAARVTAVVAGVHDTGEHALITIATHLADARNESALADSQATFLIRGAGGFGGPRPEPDRWHRPRRAPDHVVDYATTPA
ncbi:MAG: hypothetical protein WBX27_11050 [Specibacter sp.]